MDGVLEWKIGPLDRGPEVDRATGVGRVEKHEAKERISPPPAK
jgi:hypothetical protein